MSSIWDNHGLDSNRGIKILVNKFNSIKKNTDLLLDDRQNRSMKKSSITGRGARNKKPEHV